MARDTYSYQKSRKEAARKKKKEEKRQRKLDKKNMLPKDGEAQVSNENVGQGSDGNTPPM